MIMINTSKLMGQFDVRRPHIGYVFFLVPLIARLKGIMNRLAEKTELCIIYRENERVRCWKGRLVSFILCKYERTTKRKMFCKSCKSTSSLKCSAGNAPLKLL